MAHLENVSADELREVLAAVEGKKPTQRVMAAINWKEEEGVRQKDIARRYGYTQGWLSQWLTRLERLETEPFEDVVYDEPRSGRPAELSEQEHERFVNALHEPPEEIGIDAPAWSVRLASDYLTDEFGVEYCDRYVRRLLTEAGLSHETVRPERCTSDERAAKASRVGSKERRTIWTPSTRSSP